MELGYRDDGLFGGDGERDIIKVLAYETTDLGNTSTLDYCLGHYDLSNECIDEVYKAMKEKKDLSTIEEEQTWKENKLIPILNNLLLPELCKITGKNLKYCLWLCDTPDQVKDSYATEGGDIDFQISSYEKSEIILEDLGSEGKLYAYEDYPYPVEEIVE